MKFLHAIITGADHFLSPELRRMEARDLFRVRFLVCTVLCLVPGTFVPGFLGGGHAHESWLGMAAGSANLVVSAGLLWSLRRGTGYRRIAALALVWMHVLFVLVLSSWPSLFSLVYLWSSFLILVSYLFFGWRGSVPSCLGISLSSLLFILHQFHGNAPWLSITFDDYVGRFPLQLTVSMLMTIAVAFVYEYIRQVMDEFQARQQRTAVRQAHVEAVGELVGDLAHEVNNPLAILEGGVIRLTLLVKRSGWTDEARKLLVNMQHSHERIIRVQQALSVFAQGDPSEPFVRVNVSLLLKDVQLAIKPQTQTQRVQLDVTDDSAGCTLHCQRHQLVYVLCHLIQNAMEACRNQSGPRISLKVHRVDAILIFSVSDNGRGVNPDAQDRIFQPFYTTKSGGGVQGLGLSVSHGILAKHGGEIHFRSRPGATTFTCVIPLNPPFPQKETSA